MQTHHRNQRGGLGQYQPVVGEARNGQTDHLRHQNPEEHLETAHAVGHAGFCLTFGDRHEGAAEGFRQVRTEDEAQGADTGGQRVQVDVVVKAEHRRHAVEQVLTTVENQQDQYQIGNTADHRGIQVAQPGQPANRRQTQCHADQAQKDGQDHGGQGELKRQPCAIEDDSPVAFQHDSGPRMLG